MANIFRTGGVSTMRYALNEEKWTGNYWVDGKKIYRYILKATITSSAMNIDFNASQHDIDTVINITSYLDSNNPSNEVFFMINSGIAKLYYNKTLNRIQVEDNSVTSGIIYLLIYFTKTTETGV